MEQRRLIAEVRGQLLRGVRLAKPFIGALIGCVCVPVGEGLSE